MTHRKTLLVLFLLLTVGMQFIHRLGIADGAEQVLFSAQDLRSDQMKTQDAQVATANDGGQEGAASGNWSQSGLAWHHLAGPRSTLGSVRIP